MNTVTYRILTLVMLFTLVMVVTSQVTFSRDWVGGKRSDTHVDCGQFTKLCKRFIHDLRQFMSSKKFGKHRKMTEEDDLAVSYDDDK